MNAPHRRRRRREVRSPAARGSQRRAITEAISLNDLRHAVRHGEALRLAYGIYTGTGAAVDPMMALLQGLTETEARVVSHDTAGALWGILQEPVDVPIHVTSARRGGRVQRPGLVTAHRIDVPEEYVVPVRGIPVTNPAWTWVDLALSRSLDDALVLADRTIRTPRRFDTGRRHPLATHAQLWQALAHRGRSRGIQTARMAADLARDGADSPQETLLRLYMHEARLPAPRVNPLITSSDGRWRFRADLALDEFRLSIQYEGAAIHSDDERVLKDIRRAEATEALGWTEVRITKDHMRARGARAIEKITTALRRHGWQ